MTITTAIAPFAKAIMGCLGKISQINPISRGWVICFADHSSQCFSYIRDWVDKRVRGHLARSRQCPGFGWKRCPKDWLYNTLGLFHGYRVAYQPTFWVGSPPRSAP